MIDRHSFVSGALHSYPICIAFIFMYSALGMLGHANGCSLLELSTMSASIFSVPLQAFFLNNPDLSILTTVLNTLVLNFRFFLMSAILLPAWKKNIFTIPSLHFVCGSTYMVCTTERKAHEPWSFYLGVIMPSYLTAIAATIFGYLLWGISNEHQTFLNALAHIVLPIHFVCLTVKRKKERFVILASLIGFITSPMVSLIGSQFTIFIWLLIAGLIILLEEKICGKPSLQAA